MTTEELLKPRYKVIADYPNSIFKKGEIIEQFFVGESVPLYDMSLFEKYPHLFQKLEWWEERSEKDMPQYVGYKFMEYSKEKIIKMTKHFVDTNGKHNSKMFSFEGIPYSYSKCRIATREEYEQYISK